jgi:subtilase family serine protease
LESNHRTLSLLTRRPLITGLASLLVVFSFISTLAVVHASSAPAFVTLANSVASVGNAHVVGSHSKAAPMNIELVLQPNNSAQLDNLLTALYDPASSQYHHWLTTGQFNNLFAPSASQIAQVKSFLQQAGLSVTASSSSPFLVDATGNTAQVEAAFHTQVSDYYAADGQGFYQNDAAIQIPASLSGLVSAVNGMSNAAHLHGQYLITDSAAQKAGTAAPHYGAGPGGQGLTPSQINSIYEAGQVHQLGSRGEGKGATLAVFELSGYTPADIVTYENQFFGSWERVPLVDINVDGGPITPQCPKGDQCGPFSPGKCANGCDSADYSGDIEVEADIEMQIALAPKINRILVYNAPNDQTGQTVIDEYFKIANDNQADSISSSWGACEQDMGFPAAQAESIAFKQMASQGQSMFSAAGDTGAYDCLRGSGNKALAVDDPSSQPYVTGVGGTSFSSFDPGANEHPSYPKGFETVWNVLDQCSGNALNNCANFGAGGGGVSTFWAKPSYQNGPGVISSFSQKAPYCSQASSGQYCREVPDISANADEYTPYAEFCTGDPKTNSTCATFSAGLNPPGWFGIGGTSLSSPLWSGIIALWDSVHGERFGNANRALYKLFHSNYSKYFHDITGKNQTENNNGFYPTTPNYDMATGIGTPRISALAESNLW